MPRYPSTYRDRNGEVETFIEEERHRLQIMLRGVAFSGDDFDSLTPEHPLADRERDLFVLTPGDPCLCACTLEWSMPLAILAHGACGGWGTRIALTWRTEGARVSWP